jgi:hypothetical protein
MTIDEQARHQLFERLDQVLGRDAAAVLMSHLPPVGWADVATRSDLQSESALLRTDLQTLRHDLDALGTDMDRKLDALEDRMDAKFEVMHFKLQSIDAKTESRFEAVDRRFQGVDHQLMAMEQSLLGAVHGAARDHTLAMVWANVGQVLALGGLLLAAVKL